MKQKTKNFIENYFNMQELKTTIRTEVIAGVTTFMTMAYIIFVNPAMIAQAGMDIGAAMSATCVASAIATIFMGVYAKYPIALAPGMGINAFFTYTVCLSMKISWEVALGCVFIQGIIFIMLTLTKAREAIAYSIPGSIRYAIACGIGIFIAFIGLIDSGLIVANPATLVSLGDVTNPATLVSIFGLLITSVILIKKISGALLWGMLVTAAFAIPLDIVKFQGLVSLPPSMAPTFMKMDIAGALNFGLISIIFVFLFMDLFDTVGTLTGVGELGGFIKDGRFPRIGKALFSDALGSCAGAVCGTPTVTSYIESSAGISTGGRSGFASVVTGLLFFVALFFSPFVKMIGGGYATTNGITLHPVTAPALIIVGCMMLVTISKIDWTDYSESIPAFLVIIIIPLSFSIATGIAVGFISYAVIKLLSGKGKEAGWLVYLFAALFILRFLYLKSL
ncbi:MAG: NCS2 family permease [Elusimicrobia bacterium]|nr:NCS2 family permease [Candidatus Liberimonas magnetica]